MYNINLKKVLNSIKTPNYKYETIINIKNTHGKPLKNRWTTQEEALRCLNSYFKQGHKGYIRRL